MRFLLIGGATQDRWQTLLKEALAPLGKLDVMEVTGDMNYSIGEQYDIEIIDATYVEEIEKVVFERRAERPNQRIVVVTASPTWQRARAAFEAGAIDYLPKTLGQEEMHEAFEQISKKPLPPWPR